MKQLKHMKETLLNCAEKQMMNLDMVDAKELGEVIDMIKDIEEAIYYKTITEAMHEQNYDYPSNNYREMDRDYGRMYYGGDRGNSGGGRSNNSSSGSNGSGRSSGGNNSSSSSSGRGGQSYYGGDKEKYPMDDRDYREGRSPHSRRMYMESKEMHSDKVTQMRELERYMQELTQDVVEMVEDASPEEKQYLSKRVSALANKLSQIND